MFHVRSQWRWHVPGPGASEGRPAKKAPAVKKAGAASNTRGQTAAPAARKAPSAKLTAASGGATRAQKAAPKKAETVAQRSPSTKTVVASGGGSPATRKAAPKKAASPSRAKAPSEREVIESRLFKKAKTRAERVFSDPEKMRGLAVEAANKSQSARSGPISKILDEVAALVRLVVAYARGTYREVQGQSMLLILAGLIYFV